MILEPNNLLVMMERSNRVCDVESNEDDIRSRCVYHDCIFNIMAQYIMKVEDMFFVCEDGYILGEAMKAP